MKNKKLEYNSHLNFWRNLDIFLGRLDSKFDESNLTDSLDYILRVSFDSNLERSFKNYIGNSIIKKSGVKRTNSIASDNLEDNLWRFKSLNSRYYLEELYD